jgi:hypothetical protein
MSETESIFNSIKILGDEWVDKVISEGTLRNEDLAKAFMSVIGSHDQKIKDYILDEWNDVLFGMIDPKAEREYEQEDLLLEHLCDVLDAIAPDGCVFGSHEGDAACFGFWSVGEA